MPSPSPGLKFSDLTWENWTLFGISVVLIELVALTHGAASFGIGLIIGVPGALMVAFGGSHPHRQPELRWVFASAYTIFFFCCLTIGAMLGGVSWLIEIGVLTLMVVLPIPKSIPVLGGMRTELLDIRNYQWQNTGATLSLGAFFGMIYMPALPLGCGRTARLVMKLVAVGFPIDLLMELGTRYVFPLPQLIPMKQPPLVGSLAVEAMMTIWIIPLLVAVFSLLTQPGDDADDTNDDDSPGEDDAPPAHVRREFQAQPRRRGR